MEKELPWWKRVGDATNDLRRTLEKLKSFKMEFLSVIEAGKEEERNRTLSDLLDAFEGDKFSKKDDVMKFLEGFTSKELHAIKANVEVFKTEREITKRNLALEIQNLIYGAIVMESHNAILPESTWGQ